MSRHAVFCASRLEGRWYALVVALPSFGGLAAYEGTVTMVCGVAPPHEPTVIMRGFSEVGIERATWKELERRVDADVAAYVATHKPRGVKEDEA